MDWMDRLERRFGRYAVDNLIVYIVGLNGFVYLLTLIEPTGTYVRKLMLVPALVLRGEIWRLITYVFIPPSTSPLWIIFVLHFYYMIGTSLEAEWGSFKFNLYYLIGMLGTTLAAFLSLTGATTSVYLNLSLLLAFARMFPDYELLLFFILPLKVKYLAVAEWVFIGFTVLTAPAPAKIAALASVINYFVFFGKDILFGLKLGRQSYNKRKEFRGKLIKMPNMHKCTICGITEHDDPDMEFRYCSKCEGDYEYCMKHLKDHEHIRKD
jgi:hypothetical protein